MFLLFTYVFRRLVASKVLVLKWFAYFMENADSREVTGANFIRQMHGIESVPSVA